MFKSIFEHGSKRGRGGKSMTSQQVRESATDQRRARLRDALVTAAEQAIAQQGLGSLRARALAEEVGCAVGAIYNVVEDLDDLVLLVNARTLAALERELRAADRAGEPAEGPNAAIALPVLREQVRFVVTAIGRGMVAPA